jgi:hypothetical protein
MCLCVPTFGAEAAPAAAMIQIQVDQGLVVDIPK